MNDISEYLDKRLDRLEDKVDSVIKTIDMIQKFRWQIIGGSAVISAIVSLVLLIIFGGH